MVVHHFSLNFFSYQEKERELQKVERNFAKREKDMARKEEEINKTTKQLEKRSASFLITAMFKESLIYLLARKRYCRSVIGRQISLATVLKTPFSGPMARFSSTAKFKSRGNGCADPKSSLFLS